MKRNITLPCEVCSKKTFRRAEAHGSRFALCQRHGGVRAGVDVSAERRRLWEELDQRSYADFRALVGWRGRGGTLRSWTRAT